MKHMVYTTGQVAALLGMTEGTVRKYCDGGLIGSFRVPGSSYRRITHAGLVAFVKSVGSDELLSRLRAPRNLVLALGLEEGLARELALALAGDGPALQLAQDWFSLGLLFWEQWPAVVVLDFSAGRSACVHAARVIRERDLAAVIGVACEDEDGWAGPGEHRLFRAVLRPPVSAAALVRAVTKAGG